MSHGPMVPAKMLLRVKRERDLLWWIVLAMVDSAAKKAPRPSGKPRPRALFDWRARQAGER